MTKRVVIARFSLISCNGFGYTKNLDALINNRSNIIKLPSDADEELSKNKCHFPERIDDRILSKSSKLAMICSSDIFKGFNRDNKAIFGSSIGTGMEGINEIVTSNDNMVHKGYRGISPYTLIRTLGNMPCGHISKLWKLKGPSMSLNTACATGLHSIVRYGEADAVIAGGTEASIYPWSIAAFSRIKALSTKFNDMPDCASRPFDVNREGFVMSEGCGLIMMCSWPPSKDVEQAFNFQLEPIAEVVGFGRTADAFSLVAPDLTGTGAFNCMRQAMKDAKLSDLSQIGLVNCHATSTPLGDATELFAIGRLIDSYGVSGMPRSPLRVNSFKGHLGHGLGSAGAMEIALCLISMKSGKIYPTANLQDPLDVRSSLEENISRDDSISKTQKESILNAVETQIKLLRYHESNEFEYWDSEKPYVIKNSFGFGGTNATLILKKL